MFFLPVVNDEYEEVDIPVVEGMKLVANSIEVRSHLLPFQPSPRFLTVLIISSVLLLSGLRKVGEK